MDAINIILEFESDKREEIEKDIYSPERDFVDFNILIPCPQELEEQVVGSSQSSAVNLVKKYNKKFELESPTVRNDIITFLEKHKEEEYFLIRDVFIENSKDVESVINSVIAYQKYGYANWYQFKCHEWGVKWNALFYGKKRRTKSGGFYFSTANALPFNWLLVLSKKWPDVVFKVYCHNKCFKNNGFVEQYHFFNNNYEQVFDVKRKF